MSHIPFVSEEIVVGLIGDVSRDDNPDFFIDLIEKLRDENPFLLQAIYRLACGNIREVAGMLSVIEIIERQLEADRLKAAFDEP